MYHDGIMKRGEHKDATLAVLQCSINISLALAITFKRFKEDFSKKIVDGIPNLQKTTYLFMQFNPSQHFNKVKNLILKLRF